MEDETGGGDIHREKKKQKSLQRVGRDNKTVFKKTNWLSFPRWKSVEVRKGVDNLFSFRLGVDSVFVQCTHPSKTCSGRDEGCVPMEVGVGRRGWAGDKWSVGEEG